MTTSTDLGAAMRRAAIAADPRLSKFNPLPRILADDDFNTGLHGWTELIGNHDGAGHLDSIDDHMRDFRPPQLSTCTFFDVGSHGAMTGDYAMKLATRPRSGHTATAIRRLCMQGLGRVQLEAYVAYKSEAASPSNQVAAASEALGTWDGNVHPSEQLFGAFTLGSDLCGPDGRRYHCVARYLNTDLEQGLAQQWVYPTIPEPTPKEHLEGVYDLPRLADFTAPGPEYWEPFATQSLCYNEVPTKVNWHYLRWQIDTAAKRNVELQVNDVVHDLRDVPVPVYDDDYVALENLLNFYITVRTHADVRNFVYVDSALISTDW